MKDSTAIQIAKNLTGVRINIKADLDWIMFVGGITVIALKTLEYYIDQEKRKEKEAELEERKYTFSNFFNRTQKESEAPKNEIEEEPETSEE